MTPHIRKDFSTGSIDWTAFAIMDNATQPRDPDDDEDEEEEEEEEEDEEDGDADEPPAAPTGHDEIMMLLGLDLPESEEVGAFAQMLVARVPSKSAIRVCDPGLLMPLRSL